VNDQATHFVLALQVVVQIYMDQIPHLLEVLLQADANVGPRNAYLVVIFLEPQKRHFVRAIAQLLNAHATVETTLDFATVEMVVYRLSKRFEAHLDFLPQSSSLRSGLGAITS
jgi:hypothetical protein